jgi:hypothetical protein
MDTKGNQPFFTLSLKWENEENGKYGQSLLLL